MKYLFTLILLFPSLVYAIDDISINEIDSKASNANMEIYPGIAEIVGDGVDNNCDGVTE